MDLHQLARVLAVMGFIIIVLAGGLFLLARFGFPDGKMIGDIQFSRGNFTCIIPLVSGLLISIILTIVLNLLIILLKK